jgi:hypothetical protein
LNMRFATALWCSLALAVMTGPTLASSTDATPPALGAAPQYRPDFSGRWAFNVKASDDPQEKAKEAMKATKHAKGGGRGMGSASGGQGGGKGGGMGGGMGGGHQGRGSPEGVTGHSEMPPREMFALIVTAENLDITHQDPMLLIADESNQPQHLYTDFRGHSISASGGLQQRTSIAGWEGTALVVETTMIGGSKLIQTYQIDIKTGQLIIMTAANLPERQTVSYRLVYDRVKPEAEAKGR